jgi:hypothetical protein
VTFFFRPFSDCFFWQLKHKPSSTKLQPCGQELNQYAIQLLPDNQMDHEQAWTCMLAHRRKATTAASAAEGNL